MAPLSRSELEVLAAKDVLIEIAGDDLAAALQSPPFVPTRSLINLRDAGAIEGSGLPAGRVFRSGALAFAAADPEATAWLAANVRRIFDLRKPAEREAAPDPDIPGVVNVWLPTDGDYPTPQREAFVAEGGRLAWKDQLLHVATMYAPTIRAILEHVRDRPAEPFLFHCTAGRDRTGVVGCLLQTLAGTSPEDMVYDYMLSRIGTEVAREKLFAFALAQMGITDPNMPGIGNIFNLKPEFILALVEGINETYGGWDGYVKDVLGFSAEDLETIKKNLRS